MSPRILTSQAIYRCWYLQHVQRGERWYVDAGQGTDRSYDEFASKRFRTRKEAQAYIELRNLECRAMEIEYPLS